MSRCCRLAHPSGWRLASSGQPSALLMANGAISKADTHCPSRRLWPSGRRAARPSRTRQQRTGCHGRDRVGLVGRIGASGRRARARRRLDCGHAPGGARRATDVDHAAQECPGGQHDAAGAQALACAAHAPSTMGARTCTTRVTKRASLPADESHPGPRLSHRTLTLSCRATALNLAAVGMEQLPSAFFASSRVKGAAGC